MKYVLAIFGLFLSYGIMRHRESIGNSIGEMDWMRKIGGIYNIIVCIAVFIFFWSLATLSGTEDIFLYPFLKLMPFATGLVPNAADIPKEIF